MAVNVFLEHQGDVIVDPSAQSNNRGHRTVITNTVCDWYCTNLPSNASGVIELVL